MLKLWPFLTPENLIAKLPESNLFGFNFSLPPKSQFFLPLFFTETDLKLMVSLSDYQACIVIPLDFCLNDVYRSQ